MNPILQWFLIGDGIVIVLILLLLFIRNCYKHVSRRRRRRDPDYSRPFKASYIRDDSDDDVSFSSSSLYHVTHRTVPTTPVVVAIPMRERKPTECPQAAKYQKYFKLLNLRQTYFNFDFNRCYCDSCYPSSQVDYFRVAGSVYTAPRGWMRFGLKIDQAFADSKQIFTNWYTVFYGTSRDKVEAIIKNRFIPFHGDRLLTGETFTIHLSDKTHVYTSPSIDYASLDHVSRADLIDIDGESYVAKVVLECKQNPMGIIKQMGCRRGVSSIINDAEIEWKTDQRSSIVPFGLLIRLVQRPRHVARADYVHRSSSSFRRDSQPIFSPLTSRSEFVQIDMSEEDDYETSARGSEDADDEDYEDDLSLNSDISSSSCAERICTEYFHQLGLRKNYFNFDFNRCYCDSCYPPSQVDYFCVAGSVYTAPRGWMRFGLKIDQAFADSKQIFTNWYTVFYGTSRDQVEAIIKNRFIPFHGDHLLTGETFTSHLSDKKHIYTSPSINYASLTHVCPEHTVKIDGEYYKVQIVLECKQNPVGTVKGNGRIDDVCSVIDDEEIEWRTQQRSSVVPYGLLIRVETIDTF